MTTFGEEELSFRGDADMSCGTENFGSSYFRKLVISSEVDYSVNVPTGVRAELEAK